MYKIYDEWNKIFAYNNGKIKIRNSYDTGVGTSEHVLSEKMYNKWKDAEKYNEYDPGHVSALDEAFMLKYRKY